VVPPKGRAPAHARGRRIRRLYGRPDRDAALRECLRVRGLSGAGKVVLLGISRGGEGALLVGSVYPKLVHGVIAFVPNHEVNPGWSFHGGPVTPFQFIQVERIRGPILTASGGRDQVWSSSVYTEQIEQRLKEHHFRYPHERLNFPKAGHYLRGTAPVIWPRILRLMQRLREAPPGPPRAS
jgi:pimeloyl-ACP methyl ester carboxylesterase